MPYKENLKNYEEARTTYQDFLHSEGHYKNDVAKTLTYIENNYMHRLTLSSISANVNLSTSYLCRVFKSEVGTSITSYLNNLRIRKAATLIKVDYSKSVWEFHLLNMGNDFIYKQVI